MNQNPLDSSPKGPNKREVAAEDAPWTTVYGQEPAGLEPEAVRTEQLSVCCVALSRAVQPAMVQTLSSRYPPRSNVCTRASMRQRTVLIHLIHIDTQPQRPNFGDCMISKTVYG